MGEDTAECEWCGSTDGVTVVQFTDADGSRKSDAICVECKATQLIRRRARRKKEPRTTKTTTAGRVAGTALIILSVLVFVLGVAATLQSWFR